VKINYPFQGSIKSFRNKDYRDRNDKNNPFECGELKEYGERDGDHRRQQVNPEIPLSRDEQPESASRMPKAHDPSRNPVALLR